MSFTISPYFGQTVVASTLANQPALQWLMPQFRVALGNPRPGHEGNITLRIASSAAAQTASAGTILGANGANTTATLTGATYISIPWEVQEHEIDGLEFTAEDTVAYALLSGDECQRAVQNTIIADLKAGTPASSQTLSAGQARFHAESLAEQVENEEKLWAATAKIVATSGGSLSRIAIFMETTAFLNFTSGRLLSRGGETKLTESNGMFLFYNIPIFPIPGDDTITGGATNFGGLSEECAFVLGWESYGLRMGTVRGGVVEEPDNFTRLKVKLPFWHGNVQVAKQGEVLSNVS